MLDVLGGFETVKICTAYVYQGKEVKDFPADLEVLQKCAPRFVELPGWGDEIAEAQTPDRIPANAMRFLEMLSSLLGVPIELASVGAQRERVIHL